MVSKTFVAIAIALIALLKCTLIFSMEGETKSQEVNSTSQDDTAAPISHAQQVDKNQDSFLAENYPELYQRLNNAELNCLCFPMWTADSAVTKEELV